MSVLVVGTVALDSVKTPYGSCSEVLGGSATFASLSARFFSPVNLVAVVGEDFPKKHVQFLKKKGIDIAGLQVDRGETFRWEGEYGWDFSDANTLATYLNVLARFNPKLPAHYKKTPHVFLANIDPEIQMNVLNQMQNPRFVACDTMNFWIDNKKAQLLKVLKKLDLLLVNESEGRQLTGERNILKVGRAIEKLGPKKIIIKKGEHGAVLFNGKSISSIPGFLLEEVYDPTGAGDSYAGAAIGYLSTCKTIGSSHFKNAAIYGNIMATFTIEDFSVKKIASVTKPIFNKRLNLFKKYSSL